MNQIYWKIKFIPSLKDDIRLENYLAKIQDHQLKKMITKFKISDHESRIEKGILIGMKRGERFCPICPVESIEDGGHFLGIHFSHLF